jgi:RHS repeat-associated protein
MGWNHTNVYANGQLMATYDNAGLHFHLTDALGTRRAQTDYAGVWEQNFSSLPFGNALTGDGGGSDATEHHFTGKERDTESGNDYFGARYYASSMGRLLSPDPEQPTPLHLLNPQRWNMYAYGLNNPLSFTDSGGRDAAAVNFSKEIVMVGHEGIMSVTSDGTVRYARFGPVGGNRPSGNGLVQSFTLNAKIQFDSNGNPTADSLSAVKKELGTSDLSPEKGQDPGSIRINYFKTTDQETANLNQWIDQQQAASNQGKATRYNVTTTNCTMFCARGLVAAGVLDQNQANHASPAPNDFWWQLQGLQKSQPCARTAAVDSSGQGTGWSDCQ